jgi:DUF4097 and DUF4098 domain-containing protein YvlB
MFRVLKTVGIAAVALAFQLPALARCPISDGATLVVRAPVGNLRVDTSGHDAVDVNVSSSDITIREVCTKDGAEYTAGDSPFHGTIDWTIVVPRSVNLDLTTFGGSIAMGDSDATATLRTTGGPVTVGKVKGKTTIVTQGGLIHAGDIGADAEMRITSAGSLQVGNIAGNADLHTAGGAIRTGIINGKVTADASGGAIYIEGARGEATLNADAEIYIGEAAKIVATSAGGSITNTKVRGSFWGHTDSGDIRLDAAGGWVEASTGQGTIICRLVPDDLNGDLHVDLQTGVGDITIYIPERYRGSVETVIERPALNAQRIISDFPMNGIAAATSLSPSTGRDRRISLPPSPINRFASPDRQQFAINGGGNPVKLHSSLGTIHILKIHVGH